MPSVVVSWSGSCSDPLIRDELMQRLEPIARLSHGYFDEPPDIARFNGRVTGPIIAAEAVVAGCDQAVPVPDDDDPGPASTIELRLAGPLNTPMTIRGPMYSIPFVELHGMAFRLYDGRGMYPDEDLLSFVFATFPSDAAPCSRMVEVLPADQRERATRASIRNAGRCLLRPSIHLRYYYEQWVNLLLGTIKYCYVPDLFWRAYDDCPGYSELAEIMQREDYGALADRAFAALGDGLRMEIENRADEAGSIKSFWDGIREAGTD